MTRFNRHAKMSLNKATQQESDILSTCPDCCGDGAQEIRKPQRDDPYFAVSVKCETCNGTGLK